MKDERLASTEVSDFSPNLLLVSETASKLSTSSPPCNNEAQLTISCLFLLCDLSPLAKCGFHN